MKKILVISALAGILLLSGCKVINDEPNTSSIATTNSNYVIKNVLIEKRDSSLKKVYTSDEFNLYTSGVTVYIVGKDNGNKFFIHDLLKDKKISRDTITEYLEDNVENLLTYKEGGTKLYTAKDYSVLVCNKINGTRDNYYKTKDLHYDETYCN